MEKFIHDENVKLFRKRLAETVDEKGRHILQDLIEQEDAKHLALPAQHGPEAPIRPTLKP